MADATGCDIFPRFHIESLNEISKLSVSGATPLRSLLNFLVRVMRMGRTVILRRILRAPRLFPPGALLWILPHHRVAHGSLGRRHHLVGKKVVKLANHQEAAAVNHQHDLRYVFPEAFEKLFISKQAIVSADDTVSLEK